MSTVIRMTRRGRTNFPFYRIGVYDVRTRRDGREIECLGHYNPLLKTEEPAVELDLDRVRYWLSVGAQPSETMASLLKKKGIETSTRAKKRAANKARQTRRLKAEKEHKKVHGKAKRKAKAKAAGTAAAPKKATTAKKKSASK